MTWRQWAGRITGGITGCQTCRLLVGICRANVRLLWSKLSSRATSEPWTPDWIKLSENSLRPIDCTHRITLSFDHTITSSQNINSCKGRWKILEAKLCELTKGQTFVFAIAFTTSSIQFSQIVVESFECGDAILQTGPKDRKTMSSK